MSRKRFDEFYRFVDLEDLKQKLSTIKITGTSTTRRISTGGFFFGIHDGYGATNKRLAVVFQDMETSENVYNLIFGSKK